MPPLEQPDAASDCPPPPVTTRAWLFDGEPASTFVTTDESEIHVDVASPVPPMRVRGLYTRCPNKLPNSVTVVDPDSALFVRTILLTPETSKSCVITLDTVAICLPQLAVTTHDPRGERPSVAFATTAVSETHTVDDIALLPSRT